MGVLFELLRAENQVHDIGSPGQAQRPKLMTVEMDATIQGYLLPQGTDGKYKLTWAQSQASETCFRWARPLVASRKASFPVKIP